jgi:uncharacterized protein (DUF488 family)
MMVLAEGRTGGGGVAGEGPSNPLKVLTIGHSTRALAAFIEMLQAQGVRRLVDIRTVPRSRHNPQFNRETLPEALSAVGIGYTHMPALGGLRHPRPDSPNAAWRNASFRGFADYMQTTEFGTALDALIDLARQEQIAIMCAEAVPWRCHRSLIADALVARGISAEHILMSAHTQPHALTPWARVEGDRVIYPAGAESSEQGSGTRGSRGKGRAEIG